MAKWKSEYCLDERRAYAKGAEKVREQYKGVVEMLEQRRASDVAIAEQIGRRKAHDELTPYYVKREAALHAQITAFGCKDAQQAQMILRLQHSNRRFGDKIGEQLGQIDALKIYLCVMAVLLLLTGGGLINALVS